MRNSLTALCALTCAFSSFASPAAAEDLARLRYRNPGLTTDLGVGLWAWPLPMDWDGDGDLDLLVSCPDKPSNGVWFFENPAGKGVALPVFKPGVRLGPAAAEMCLSTVNGQPRLLAANQELTGFRNGDWKTRAAVFPQKTAVPVKHPRDCQWKIADYDGDGAHDLIAAHGDWTDYGFFNTNDWWKDYNHQGVWTGSPLHGPVFWLRNTGTDTAPVYAAPEPVAAAGKPVDVYGRPTPNFADFDGDGDLDLLCGEFLDGFTYFQNTGTRTVPVYAEGRRLSRGGAAVVMDLEMIVPHAIDWDGDGDTDLICGDEDGRVAFLEHLGPVVDGMPQFADPKYFRQEADTLKSGALCSPTAVDWDGDGDHDLICGNTAGYLEFFENLGVTADGTPKWAAPSRLETGGNVIRVLAGPSGSLQGPCEAKWGYTTVSAADWDLDGVPDLVVNSIWGRVEWYRNTGTRTAPALAPAAPVTVAWTAAPPKPVWNWWNPRPGELITQWRTTPSVFDLNTDGLPDLVMLDHEGWLCFWERQRDAAGALTLLPGKRVVCDEAGNPMRLNDREGGRSGRRKLHVADWDGDGKPELFLNSANVERHVLVEVKDGRWLFRNTGNVSTQNIEAHDTSPTTADFDGDGKKELIIGAEDGRLYFRGEM